MGTAPEGRRGTARLLAVCAVLFGLFLMHGSPADAASGCHGALPMPMPVGDAGSAAGAAPTGAPPAGQRTGQAASGIDVLAMGGDMPARMLRASDAGGGPRVSRGAFGRGVWAMGGDMPADVLRASDAGGGPRDGLAAPDHVVALRGGGTHARSVVAGAPVAPRGQAGHERRALVRTVGGGEPHGAWCVATPVQQRLSLPAPGLLAFVAVAVLALVAAVGPRVAAGGAGRRGPPPAGRRLLLQVGVART